MLILLAAEPLAGSDRCLVLRAGCGSEKNSSLNLWIAGWVEVSVTF